MSIASHKATSTWKPGLLTYDAAAGRYEVVDGLARLKTVLHLEQHLDATDHAVDQVDLRFAQPVFVRNVERAVEPGVDAARAARLQAVLAADWRRGESPAGLARARSERH